MNVVSASTVERLKLLVTTPSTFSVTQRYLVFFSCVAYNDSMCDMIPMTYTHILLGRPWLYDCNVQHCGRENAYSFLFNNEENVLKPMSVKMIRRYEELYMTKEVSEKLEQQEKV